MQLATPNYKMKEELGLGITSEAFDLLTEKNLDSFQQCFLLDTASNTGQQEDMLKAMAKRLHIPCEEKYFVVCVISVRANTSSLGHEVLRVMIRETLSECVADTAGSTAFFTDQKGNLNCVVNTYDPEPRKKIEAAVAEARLRLRAIADLHLFFAVGPSVNSLSRLYISRSVAYENLLLSRSNISTAERIFESGVVGLYTYSVQEQIMARFLDMDAVGVSQILNSHLRQLREDEGTDIRLAEGFLFSYLRRITCHCVQNGISVEQFENYLPSVLYLMQSDIENGLEAITKLTEQILNHISFHGTNETNHLLGMAKEYVRDHIADEKLNLESVSNHVGLSRVYFCKLFHQMEGISFTAYLKKIRIEKAKQLLITTNLKVFEISNAVGFSHAKYFGQVFKQEVGKTPVEFQKHFQNNR